MWCAIGCSSPAGVQGVFFRDSCRTEANRRGVTGWVRNRDDGAVEAVFEGPPEDVRRLVDWAHTGPRLRRRTTLPSSPNPRKGSLAFHIR